MSFKLNRLDIVSLLVLTFNLHLCCSFLHDLNPLYLPSFLTSLLLSLNFYRTPRIFHTGHSGHVIKVSVTLP